MEQKNYLHKNIVLSTLINNGYKAYFVGGIVRDYILNNIHEDIALIDIDITTNAKPKEVKSLFENTYDTGIKHGTVTVIYDAIQYEITTFRKEYKYLNNRFPKKVKYINKLKSDIKRRDFTINAIAMNQNLKIIDYFNGISDIENKVIRTVGNPNKRFKEDALRMLRAIRFSCKLNFTISSNTLQSITKNKSLLENISKERIYSEFKKAIKGDYIKNLKYLAIFNQFKKLNLYNVPEEKNYILRLAYIIHNIENISILTNLKVDKNTIIKVNKVLSNINYMNLYSRYGLKRLISSTDFETVKIILILKKIDLELYNDIYESNECIFINQLKITGEDLIKNNIAKEGIKIGKILNQVLDEVLKKSPLNEYKKLIELSKSFS